MPVLAGAEKLNVARAVVDTIPNPPHPPRVLWWLQWSPRYQGNPDFEGIVLLWKVNFTLTFKIFFIKIYRL